MTLKTDDTTESPRSEERPPRTRALNELLSMARLAPSKDAFVNHAARTIAEHFASPAAFVNVVSNARDSTGQHVAPGAEAWLKPLDDLLVNTLAERRTLARLYYTKSGDFVALVGAPIPNEEGRPIGAFASVTACANQSVLEAVAAEADAVAIAVGSALVACTARTPTNAEDTQLAQTIQRTSAYENLNEFAFALTNNLRNRLGAETVVLGLPKRGRIRLAAISGLDDVKPRSPGTAVMSQALEEAADLGRTVCAQRDDAWNENICSTGHKLQRAWSDAVGGAAVLSVPLLAGEDVVAVVGIRNGANRHFRPEDIEETEKLLSPFAAAIPVLTRASRGLLKHAADNTSSVVRAGLAPRAIGRKLAAAAGVALFAWFWFGTTTYRVPAATTLAAAQTTRLSAPFEAELSEVLVTPGQRVSQGDPIVVFDTETTRLQAGEARAELRAHTIEADRALSEGDHSAAALSRARADLASARLARFERTIESAIVRAPADGVLLSGDTRHRTGEMLPLGEPLFDFAPDVALRWELSVPEHAADEVVAGMQASFSPSARPEHEERLVVRSVAPSAEVRGGAAVIIAEAEASDLGSGGAPEWLRPGMQGVARIDAGPKPVWWVALHRITDALHMTFNKWR